MRVRLTSELSFEQGPVRQPGEVLDLPDAQAAPLLRLGLVEVLDDLVVETPDPAIVDPPEATTLDDAGETATVPRARKRG